MGFCYADVVARSVETVGVLLSLRCMYALRQCLGHAFGVAAGLHTLNGTLQRKDFRGIGFVWYLRSFDL